MLPNRCSCPRTEISSLPRERFGTGVSSLEWAISNLTGFQRFDLPEHLLLQLERLLQSLVYIFVRAELRLQLVYLLLVSMALLDGFLLVFLDFRLHFFLFTRKVVYFLLFNLLASLVVVQLALQLAVFYFRVSELLDGLV